MHFGPRTGIERCGKINAMNSGPESCTGIGVVAWLFVILRIPACFVRSMSGAGQKVQIWAIIQLVRGTPKLATT